VTIPAQDQLDSVDLTGRFLALFGQRFGSLVSAPGVPSWRRMSQFHYLSDDEILNCISLEDKKLRACLLDAQSIFSVISVPPDSPYRQPYRLKSLVDCLNNFGLLTRVYRVDASDAVQIYLPFSERIQTDHFSQLLSNNLASQGYVVSPSSLIVHSTKHPVTLPLQQEFCWLNDSFESKLNRADLPKVSAIAVFMRDLQIAAPDPIAVFELLSQEPILFCLSPDIDTSITSASSDELEPTQACAKSQIQMEAPAIEVEAEDSAEPNIFDLQNKQLMLFQPLAAQEISALPKGRPKRGKRPRSALPDTSESGTLATVKSFPSLVLARLADSEISKEVPTENT